MDGVTAMQHPVYRHMPPGLKRPGVEARPANYRVKLLSAVNSMPPLPAALNRLLGMLNSESVSAGQVARVIEGDSVLSGNVMRCVNSPYYGLPRRVSSIRHAVALLGFQTVRNLALAFSMRRMMTGSAASRLLYNSYSRHALATALLTQTAASETHSCEIETAFAAGLFHDVGKLLVYTAAPEAVTTIVNRWESGEGSYEEAELEVIETTHSELSAIVLEGWKLPDEICNAARYHHAPEDCPGEPDSEAPSLARLVQAADMFVNSQGYRTPESRRAIEADAGQALENLGLRGDAQAAVSRFRDGLEKLQELLH